MGKQGGFDMISVAPTQAGLIKSKKGLKKLAEAGFENMSLDFNVAYSAYNLGTYENMEPDYMEFMAACRDLGLKLTMARAPYLLPSTGEPGTKLYKPTDPVPPGVEPPKIPMTIDELADRLIEVTIKCVEYAGKLGCEYIVVQPLFAGVKKGVAWKLNHDYYMRLGKVASENNIMVLLENLYTEFNGHIVRGTCSDPYKATEWIDVLNSEIGGNVFGFCMDVGVCTACGQNMHEFALVLGHRIKAVVMRDGVSTHFVSRQLPYTYISGGKPETDWLSLIRGLREVGFDGQIITEFCESVYAMPLRLQKYIYSLAYEMGEYFIWQLDMENVIRKYDKRVLFGAGNMCRNYMKCYGEDYPPLFTCDNDRSIWGTTFEGLEVKSPEALRELPDDCAIFICNTFYDEIKEQLVEMGITNPIEYFNDENMPSLYLDRFDSSKREVR
jgi:sugar phosphate isomerase/epimerase